MPPNLLERARSAVTVEEECDAVRDFVCQRVDDAARAMPLIDIIVAVRAGRLPRAVLLGVVAALVPEGMAWGVNGPFTHADGATHWEAYCRALDWLSGPTPALALLIAIREASNAD
ncbi:hypothetical protein FZ983_32320 [Azospirillum sp. B21]|uniref:hypothetical protein n=1 Tax=Azospirillum sp. B21 TaxID=2607496 RepID=UPI0011ED3927|nr:hypothetical protein [Azospirillum sp. B21]KAA0572258.1 hypothetical protein FZ983_32320 [Azospirillum sp. B21]